MTLEVNKDYIFKSAFTGEEFTASYRGETANGRIAVWTGKMQIYIPREWAVREYKPIEWIFKGDKQYEQGKLF